MTARRIVILGNSGSGKTTMARRLQREHALTHLDLDSIAWGEPGIRLPLAESIEALTEFNRKYGGWVIEGSYASLAEAALPMCSEFRFLNPGVEACVENCRRRPWEPEKYASLKEQNERLPFLLQWVREYDTRDDEYGLARHRAIYEEFSGPKLIYLATDL